MPAKTFRLPEPLTDADKTFMERMIAARDKKNDALVVNGRNVIVVRRSLE